MLALIVWFIYNTRKKTTKKKMIFSRRGIVCNKLFFGAHESKCKHSYKTAKVVSTNSSKFCSVSDKIELELWNSKVCPFGQRAWFTMLQKDIPKDKYVIHWEDLENKSQVFKNIYSKSLFNDPQKDGLVPTILHNGNYITGTCV